MVTSIAVKNPELVMQMKQLFPDACEIFINKCVNQGLDLDALLDKFASESYVKSSGNCSAVDEMLSNFHQRLCDMLPKFDPDYLLEEAKKLPQLSEQAFSNCVSFLLDMKEYPTIADYKKRQTEKEKMLKYLFDLKIDMFLKEFSYNLKSFENSKRKHSLLAQNVNQTEFENNKRFAYVMLCYIYSGVQAHLIEVKLKQFQYDILAVCESLGRPQRKDFFRNEVDLPPNSYKNKLMFQELAYVMHRDLINNYLKIRTSSYERAYKEAEAANQLQTCRTCFEEGLLLMPEESYQCTNGCNFCKQCMIRGCEVAYGDGLLEIDCFDGCGATFSDYILQMVMDPVAYVKLMQRKQIKAVREALRDDFETCPFCDYGTVMSKEDKIFICRNSECGKESCRECQHEAHIPLRCNEIEYDEDVKMRTYIENQMAAALIRVCKKCNRQIIKETGCNKMTCVCGQTMCYVCGESGITYNHFGMRCPQQSNQEQLHRDDILRSIQAAKAALGVDRNPNKLKFDPSKGF
ncbi:E3 ubiquitin-protein ligase RNF216-like isoform X2 [Atheta coriaria]